MSPSLQQGLKDFGLAVEKGGKHYKISFPRDDRYWTTILRPVVTIGKEKILRRESLEIFL